MGRVDPSKIRVMDGNGNVRKVNTVYIGRNGKAVKIWDKENGFTDKESYETFMKSIGGNINGKEN